MVRFNIEQRLNELFSDVERQVISRATRASNVLRSQVKEVLRGQRSGKRYRVPGTSKFYTASAPGEPPASRTGNLRQSFKSKSHSERTQDGMRAMATTYTQVPYAKYLDPAIAPESEAGQAAGGLVKQKSGHKIEPRPFVERTKKRAWPAIKKIYGEHYLH